jgi:hypothetical protein
MIYRRANQVPVSSAYYPFESPRQDSFVGYHGTSADGAAKIASKGFVPSQGSGEWLGHGVYFWKNEDAAWVWADRHRKPAVVRATVFLGYCLDLDTPVELKLEPFFKKVHGELDSLCRAQGKPLPVNDGHDLRLTCEIMNLAAIRRDPPTDSIICTFQVGDPLFPGAELRTQTRRQICVRNLTNIHYPRALYQRSL